MKFAEFYFRTKEYSAARYCYLDILESHRDKTTQNHAMVRTILATQALKEWQPCLDYVEKFYDSVEKGSRKEIKLAKKNCAQKQ
jgi:hypothetical protein